MSETNTKSYPKVLIYGASFKPTGGGVTLATLFKSWPIDKIAIATDLELVKDESICTNYYRLSSSHAAKEASSSTEGNVQRGVSPVKMGYRFLFRWALYLKSLRAYPRVIDHAFLQWVKAYNPEIIYAFVYRIHQIPLLLALQEETGLPLAIHFGDDWVRKYKFGIMSLVGKFIFHKELVKLTRTSAIRFAISDDMKNEFEKRYHGEFHTLHNTVDIKALEHLSRTSWDYSGKFGIMYAGTLEEYNMKELIDLCEATKGLPVEIHLYGSTRDGVHKQTLESYPQCTHRGLVTHDEILRLYPQYDLLYLPLTFNPKLLGGVKLSMPTKVSEYMISKTPSLVYAHPDSSLTKYAEKEGWALVLKKPSVPLLRDAVINLMQNEGLRRSIGEKAAGLAVKNHSTESNLARFIQLLNKAVQQHERKAPAVKTIAATRTRKLIVKIQKLMRRFDKLLVMPARVAWFRLLGINAGRNLKIWGKLIIEGKPENIIMGHNCSLNSYVLLEAGEKIIMGNEVALSSFVQIHTSGTDLSIKPLRSAHVRKPVIIGNSVWIGSGAIIVSGITIGDDVVVAANSTVTKDLESGYLYAGSPAKPKKKLYEQDK